MNRMTHLLSALLVLLVATATGLAQANPSHKPLPLAPGDHVAVIGNALADRMQHHAWLETYITAHLPQHDLTFRNLAVAGDEVTIRHRSANFGSPDEWLSKVEANVIFAFFGFNESFAGPGGLDQFKADLDQFIRETQGKNYSGEGAPTIVLFSPIANERHQDSNFPDPDQNNLNIELYTAAMAEVAALNQVPFVDLYRPSLDLFDRAAAGGLSLTVNGLHLTEEGDRALARVIFEDLFQTEVPAANLDKLRHAILDKNAEWHARYRTIDGYNVYGGRSQLSYESPKGGPKISNYHVMQQEMSQRDVLTANRDKRIWAVAKGSDLEIDDSNLPEVTPVQSNKPGPEPDNSFPFLTGEEAIAKMTVHSGMKVNLFASEEDFPLLANPVQMAWDTRGRLWVAAWLNYPGRRPLSTQGDSLLIFEDTDHDGRADRCIPFLDDLNGPTGFQFYKDGVLVVQAPDLWFARDTDGDGRADTKERVLMGLDSADSHHTSNALAYDPGGAIYLSDGVFHRTQVERANGVLRNNDGAIYRFEPRTGRFETYVAYGFANPHGRVFDRWGNDIVTDATGNANYFGAAFSGHIDYPKKHPGMKQFWDRPSRPCAATAILTSSHFPEEFQGNFLNCNVIGFQGIYRVGVTEEGSGLKGETLEPIVSSEDPNFRPVDVSVGADGALYFLDWHNPIIGHMQHHLRDPNRDDQHGRIYRVTYEGRPLLSPPPVHNQPIPALLDLLKLPENGTRVQAKTELGRHPAGEVIPAVRHWLGQLDPSDPNYQHHRTEALWVHQWMNVVDPDLLNDTLQSPDHRARAAAARVLCYWRDRVPDALQLFKKLADDPHPRVRLEAVRAASFYRSAEAAEVALAILKHPTDYYLDYTLKETMRQLEPWWREAVASGQPIAPNNPAGIDYVLDSIPTRELVNLPKTKAVLLAFLTRPGIADAERAVALAELAELENSSRAELIFHLLQSPHAPNPEGQQNLARQLAWLPARELQPARHNLRTLAESNHPPAVRAAAWAALAVADQSFDQVWDRASGSPQSLTDLLSGIPLLLDPEFRAKAYARVGDLLGDPSPIDRWARSDTDRAAPGRFVRIELPRRGTLTLAEVEVFSDGRNIASQGKTRQSSVTHGGNPDRAIDGRTDGSYGSGTQTHTRENEQQPWWELDLGRELPLESIKIWNRTDDNLGDRLQDFTLLVLDTERNELFRSESNPAPKPSMRIEVGQDTIGKIQRSAINALVSMNTDPTATFATLANLIQREVQITAAARALRDLPRGDWPAAHAPRVAGTLLAWAQTVPVSQRTAQDYVETIQVIEDLSGLLPEAQAASTRRALTDLRVPVFVIRAVREQMRYDTPRLVVEAGKPFEIIVENPDFMPHNLVVVTPGSRERVGQAADKMRPDALDSKGRPFVPQTGDVLAATPLLEAGGRYTLAMTAPQQEGEYTYVCTFPGHWMVMWGRLIVTDNVSDYLRENPQAKDIPAEAAHHHHLE